MSTAKKQYTDRTMAAASAAVNGGEFIYSLATREKVQGQVFGGCLGFEDRHCGSCRCPEMRAEAKATEVEFAKEALRFTGDAAKANLIAGFGRLGQSNLTGDSGFAIIKDSEHYSDVKETPQYFEFTFDADSARPKHCPNLRFWIEESGACTGGGTVRLHLEKDLVKRECSSFPPSISRILEGATEAEKAAQRAIEQEKRNAKIKAYYD